MKQHDEYIAGPHSYWVHFWCGIVFGALLGLWIGWNLFEQGWAIPATSLATALAIGYSCGRWGDGAWQWVISRLDWFC
jgi:hypothetical protein